jgi:pimeloyl-ACP methyl ester carboxylesterase
MSWSLPDRVTTSTGTVATAVLGSGPPVVLTHGTPSWSYLWREVAPVLAEHHTVHLWDLPTYGDSEAAPGERPSVALHARTLADLVAHWGLDAPALVGHDIGAATVLRAHLVHEVAASRIVLLDAAVLAPWVTGVAQHMQAHPDAYRSMPTALFGEVIAAHLHTTTHRPLSREAARAYLDRYAGEQGQQRYLDQVDGFTEDDTRDVVALLHEIAVPTAVLWGAEDRWLPVDHAAQLAARLGDAPVTTVDDAGHFLTEDAPAEVAAALLAALTPVGAGA